jgi:hypothetical protein
MILDSHKFEVFLFLVFVTTASYSGPISDLDSSSRKAVREATMAEFGAKNSEQGGTAGLADLDSSSRRIVREAELGSFRGKGENYQGGLNSTPGAPGVFIQNTVDQFGRKTCSVSAGQVATGTIKKGSSTQNVTVVTGNVVNVCQK